MMAALNFATKIILIKKITKNYLILGGADPSSKQTRHPRCLHHLRNWFPWQMSRNNHRGREFQIETIIAYVV